MGTLKGKMKLMQVMRLGKWTCGEITELREIP